MTGLPFHGAGIAAGFSAGAELNQVMSCRLKVRWIALPSSPPTLDSSFAFRLIFRAIPLLPCDDASLMPKVRCKVRLLFVTEINEVTQCHLMRRK